MKNGSHKKLIILEGSRQNGLHNRNQHLFLLGYHVSKLISDVFRSKCHFSTSKSLIPSVCFSSESTFIIPLKNLRLPILSRNQMQVIQLRAVAMCLTNCFYCFQNFKMGLFKLSVASVLRGKFPKKK